MTTNDGLLNIYLNDHLAGSSGGLALARRLAGNHRGTPAGSELAELARDVEEDRDALVGVMAAVGARTNPLKPVLALVAERVGRLKLNGTLLRRSPLSSVLELEMMRLGVEGKSSAWRSLREVAKNDPRLDAAQLDELIRRAKDQAQRLERLRTRAAAEALQHST